MIKTLNVEAEHNELVLKNNHGDYVIIPADKRDWVKTKLAEGCHTCIDSLVESLPIMDDYAEEGTVIPGEPEKEVKKEETIVEFKKMTVSFKTHDMMSKASTDLAKQGFTISGTMKALKVDGKGADLNKYATDLKNNYGATIVAEENLKEADPITYGPDKVAKAMAIAVKSDGQYSLKNKKFGFHQLWGGYRRGIPIH